MAEDTIVRVDPKTLLVGPNVRKEITLQPEFVASVKEHGVKIPIVAHETKDGLEVVDGQMRTLAALDAGLTEVPVFVRSATSTDAERVVDQLVVNRDRTSLSRADTVAAVKQLALDFKMPAAAVAKKVGIPKKDVENVLAIAADDNATTVLEHDSISLEIAARVAEAGLSKAEVTEVVKSHSPEHALQQIINRHADEARMKELVAELTEAGVPVVAKPSKGDYYAQEKNKHLYIDGVLDKESGSKITVEQHKVCAGHAAFVGARGYSGKVEIHYVCTDPSKFGHRDADRAAPTPLTDAVRAERAENSAAAKVWPGIVEVRRTWIREQLLTRKTMPAGWEKLVAWVDLNEAGTGGSWEWGKQAAELLGLKDAGYNGSGVIAWLVKNPTKHAVALVAVAIAQIELSLAVSKSWKGWRGRKVGEYSELLASWGYGLSDLEKELVLASKKVKKAS